jgi:hypothetical protein
VRTRAATEWPCSAALRRIVSASCGLRRKVNVWLRWRVSLPLRLAMHDPLLPIILRVELRRSLQRSEAKGAGGRGGDEAPSRRAGRRTPGRWASRGRAEVSRWSGGSKGGTKARPLVRGPRGQERPMAGSPEGGAPRSGAGAESPAQGMQRGRSTPCQDEPERRCAVLHAHILRTLRNARRSSFVPPRNVGCAARILTPVACR